MRPFFTAITLLFATPLAAQDATFEAGPADFLEGYYARLREQVTLPVAPPAAPMPSTAATITRIAFGSCNHQHGSQHMWERIAATSPDLFLLIGDNVYGDTNWTGDAALTTLRNAYAVQAGHPEFAAFRAIVPMLTTWDDHDFGFNDGGASFAFKGWAEEIYENFWDAPPQVRARPGVYDSRMFGHDGRTVQVIMLDTRFFRSDLERYPYSDERRPLGNYPAREDAGKTMLGAAQWAWLEQELAKPADLRILVSSIQVLTDAHDFEGWETMLPERRKLYQMLQAREQSGLVILSGDRHAGGIYTDTPIAAGEQLWELTSSSLNRAFTDTPSNTAREPDPRRLTDFISEENFGLVEIDWQAKQLTMKLLGNQGEERASESFGWEPPISDAPLIMDEPVAEPVQ